MRNRLELPRFVAVTGREGSGKDTYGNHLATAYGYMHVAAGDVLRQRARQLGHMQLSREVLSQVGDAMKQEFGPAPVARSTIAAYEQSQAEFPGGLVINGLRRVEELQTFKDHGAVALWIDADDARRFANLQNRGAPLDAIAFAAKSREEYFGTTAGGAASVNLQAIEAMADCWVVNDGTPADLFRDGDATLSSMVR